MVSDTRKGGKKLNRQEKAQVIADLQDKFNSAKGVIFTDYRGLTVKEITELRSKLKSSSLEYRVVKNTLARRAAKGTPVDAAKDMFRGPVGLAIGYDDPVALAKEVIDFSKTNEKLEIRGGVIEGGVCNPEELKAISKLPSREVLLSMLVGAFQAPMSRLAGLLNATLTRFVYALEALKQKKGEQA